MKHIYSTFGISELEYRTLLAVSLYRHTNHPLIFSPEKTNCIASLQAKKYLTNDIKLTTIALKAMDYIQYYNKTHIRVI